MSTASRSSVGPSRRLKNSSRESGRPRAHSRSRSRAHHVVEHDEARSFALRTAFLHYLLQPRAKRKQYVSAPAQKAPARSYTSVGQLVQEYVSGSSTTLKLPHNFAQVMLDRLGGILRGIEPLPGFKDAAVKRSFAEAYTAFSEKNFRKTMDKERKFEPLVLIFYSSATKAAQKGCAPDDDSWKLLPDRHLALFVRLSASVLKETGHERDRPELMSRLTTLENKLLTNDQDLVGGSGGDAGGTTIEVTVPLSYEVKDMPMVQVVASIFGQTLSEVQSEINEKRNIWTAEAAVRDLKTYQTRLSSDGSGALSSQDFDLDNAFEEWKRAEAPHLSQMLLDILTANPELAKSSNSHLTQSRPQSFYGEDQMYADLSRAISNDDPSSILDPASGLASLALSDVGSIRSVDAGLYTFIPPDPRAYYKYILHHAMAHDQLHADPNADHYQPLSKPSMDLMTELCVCWRISQSTRLVTLLEVAAKKFMDQEILPEELEATLDIIKSPQPEPKKPPHIQQYNIPLTDIPCSRWTMKDFSGYRNTLQSLYDSLLRELYGEMLKSYETDAPKIGPIMMILENHISSDQNFAAKPEAVADFAEHLEQALRQNANDVYRRQMQKIIPAYKEEWDFLHVVKLGKTVTKLCDKLRKRFKTCPEIFSVRPLPILVQEVLPSFENDAGAIIDTILAHAAQNELELTIEDGFELYREMVEIRRIHQEALPDRKFTFNLEDRLVDFVWRWVGSVEQKMDEFVEQAIKQDQFQVRADSGDQVVPDVNRHSVSVIDLFMLFNQSVNQVHQLSWANHVHHARFMNALARAFSAGIGKYCDTLEQRFVREMDRPSADEVIAKGRTTQEKWMQYAKDALTTKEKAEPFQFYPESFVKLNNIEYAMQALDKMEKSMNVDGCAAAIERADGPKKNVKKPSKYTFTIKVVEAEDLKACDSNGFSDPYVVFGDEYQKRLHKTRIINKNLNPRWDESFDVTVQGPVHMIATIWDYDTIGDHDYVGRTSLRLDPGQFSDYLPREFWLDLDTQGRLLIRASMEGERDDIQFHFGKAFRHLKRTERDMVRKITDKLTSEINATLSRHTLRALLGTSGISASVTNLWKKRAGQPQTVSNPNDAGNALASLFAYFDDNFAIMKETLTDATMIAVMTRLWKEVLMTVENLLVPPVSDKPSNQRPLSRQELDIVYQWLDLLFGFFNARDEQSGEQLGVPAEVLKSPKWHDLASLNFFYFEDSNSLIQESERMATATAQRAKDALLQHNQHTTVAPPSAVLGANLGGAGAFASMGTIRRGKSIMMSRNLGTMRKAKEAKRRDTQADPSDDMILRILRMRPEAAHYLRDRHRQKERQAATAAAALIVRNSVAAGRGPAGSSAAQLGRNLVPRR